MKKILDFLFRRKSQQIPLNAAIEPKTQSVTLHQASSKKSLDGLSSYPPQLTVGMGQSVGRLRDHNEDTIFSLTSTFSDSGDPQTMGLYIVADGMGGHSHGEIASAAATRYAVDYLLSTLFSAASLSGELAPEKSVQEMLTSAVQAAHLAVVKQAPGGGTTLTMVLAIKEQVTLAHVGDSRAYLIEDGKFRPLTSDHSLVRRLVELGQLTEEQSKSFPQKNYLYRALGQGEPLIPDLLTISLPEQSTLMLCSDGLWGVVDEKEILRLIIEEPDPVACCQKLVIAANQAGGPDNISVILVKHR